MVVHPSEVQSHEDVLMRVVQSRPIRDVIGLTTTDRVSLLDDMNILAQVTFFVKKYLLSESFLRLLDVQLIS